MHTRSVLKKAVLPLLLILALLLPSAALAASPGIPAFSGAAAIELNGNVPAFSPGDSAAEDYVEYSALDALGRPGPASACLSRASLPTGLRAESGGFLPVGWQTVRYAAGSDETGGERWQYLYSLCCLISPALGGSDAEERNVFTGTRCLRTEGMQLYEDLVAGFLARTAYHILYRVTPVYEGDELVARGVKMEAYSVEDAGRTLSFNVFLYNVQPGFAIDYRSGNGSPDAAVAVSAAAKTLIASHEFPPMADPAAPSVASFSALGGQVQGQSKKPANTQKIMLLWVTGTGTKYHSVNPCGNTDFSRAHQEEVDITTKHESDFCKTCCQSIINTFFR